MALRNFLLAAAALPGLVLGQDGSMCMVKTTFVPVYVTTTIGGPAMTSTQTSGPTVTVVPTPAPTFNLATAPAGSTFTEGTPIVLIYTAPQPNSAATIDLVQVGPSPGSYIGSKRDTSTVLVKTITTNAMGGNFTWTPDKTLPSASNYALRVSQGGQQVQMSNTFVLVAAPAMSSSMSMSTSSSTMMSASSSMMMSASSSMMMSASSSMMMSASSSIPTLTKAAPVTTSSTSVSAPTVTSNLSTSTAKVLSTAAPATINGGGAVVETQYVQGAPKTTVVNTFSTTVTATSTAYAQTSTAVATAVATSTSITYTSTAVVTVTPPANNKVAVPTAANVGDFNGILTITVTTTAIPQARRGAAGFFGF